MKKKYLRNAKREKEREKTPWVLSCFWEEDEEPIAETEREAAFLGLFGDFSPKAKQICCLLLKPTWDFAEW